MKTLLTGLVLSVAAGFGLCGGVRAETFPLTPAEAANPLIVDVADETTWTAWLATQGGGGG